MKKILFRKLLLDCLVFFLIALISASIIIWVFQAVNFLDIMIEDGRSYTVYISYALLNFPKIISKILPFSLFFSFSYVLAKYEINNELIVFWNNGVDKISLINFFLKFSLVLMFFQILFTTFIVPKSQEIGRTSIRTSNIDFIDSFVKPKKFNDTIKDLTIYADKKDKNGNLENIYLKKGNDINFQITYAKKGRFETKGNVRILALQDGQTINGVNNKITNFNFSKFDLNLSNITSNTITSYKTQELSSKKLILCAKNLNKYISEKSNKDKIISLNCNLRNLDNIYKELYKRLIIPTYLPILITISLILIIKSKESINYLNYRILIFLFGLLTIIFSEASIKLINDNMMTNIIILSLPSIIFLIIYSSMFYNLRLKFKI
jgi:lipopolysaccharide export system permease protein